MRHDPVASPQDGTPTKQVSDKTRPRNRCGSLWARMHRQDNETPALNALKALRGAPISMGRGETPVLRIGRRYIIRRDVIHKFMEANQGVDLLVREQIRAVR